MAKREKGRAAVRLVTALLAIALLILAALFMFRVGSALLRADLSASETDPMFAEPSETVTRPPELDMEATVVPHLTLDDYVQDVQTPVDKTAEELIKEAKNADPVSP